MGYLFREFAFIATVIFTTFFAFYGLILQRGSPFCLRCVLYTAHLFLGDTPSPSYEMLALKKNATSLF